MIPSTAGSHLTRLDRLVGLSRPAFRDQERVGAASVGAELKAFHDIISESRREALEELAMLKERLEAKDKELEALKGDQDGALSASRWAERKASGR